MKKDVYRGITIHGGYHEKDGCISYYIDIIWSVLFTSNKKTLDLPDASKVEFAHVHGGATTTVYELNQTTISSLIKDIEEKSSYSKESVNDNPNNVDYIKVKMDTKTYYVYERNGKTYIEEPYNGIWKIPSDLYKTIKNNKDKLIVEYED